VVHVQSIDCEEEMIENETQRPGRARRIPILVALVGAALGGACSSYDAEPLFPHQVVTGSGDVNGAVGEFRALLGDPLNGVTPGTQPAGRREINWDGVPAGFTDTDAFPGDFFNTRSPRGAVFSTPGQAFRVSSTNLADVDPSYGGQFGFFSPQKTFAVTGSNVMTVEFQVPGSSTPAAVRGFGVVFADVDQQGSATIEFFGPAGSLGRFEAPVRSGDGSLSFLGVAFQDTVVTSVRIVSGRAPLGAGIRDVSDGGNGDLVVMDDFLYSEPRAIQ
jgi:hypothetical protein